MEQSDILAKVKQTVAEMLEMPVGEQWDTNTKLFDDLSYDELGLVETLVALEESFDLDLPDEDFDQWETIGDMVASVERALKHGR